MRRFPIRPAHPERTCWGCDRYCAAGDLRCGNGSERTQHPVELFGDDWLEWQPPAEAAGSTGALGACAPDLADARGPKPTAGAASQIGAASSSSLDAAPDDAAPQGLLP